MKRFNIFLVFLVVFMGCRHQEKHGNASDETEVPQEYQTVGKEINAGGALLAAEMSSVYNDLAVSDSLSTKFTAKVTEVCQAKGCWMKVQLKDGHEAMVRFKDYGFFVPKDLSGKEVVINGLAFVEETDVEELKHLAKDGGKSEEEIAAITDKQKTYGFDADGVLILK